MDTTEQAAAAEHGGGGPKEEGKAVFFQLILNDDELEFLNKFANWWNVRSSNAAAASKQLALKTWTNFVSETKKADVKSSAIQVFHNSVRGSRNAQQLAILQDMCLQFGFVEATVPSSDVHRFCQNLEYSELHHDEVIFLQGDKPTGGKYYMLLDGKVEFLAKDGRDAIQIIENECSREKRKHMDSETLRRKLGKSVFTRLSGPFGEMALITGERRTASAMVTEGARLVTCSREVYRECLLRHQREKMELVQNLNFLKDLTMLRTWGNDQILRLVYDLSRGATRRARRCSRRARTGATCTSCAAARPC